MKPSLLLKLEGLLVFAAALFGYSQINGNWILFALLILAPDVSMLGYLKDVKLGAFIYNAVHTYILPVTLIAVSYFAGFDPGLTLAIIWIAHIGMDRLLGFGLKYPTEFKDTHLQRL
jgi:hypothetical protein